MIAARPCSLSVPGRLWRALSSASNSRFTAILIAQLKGRDSEIQKDAVDPFRSLAGDDFAQISEIGFHRAKLPAKRGEPFLGHFKRPWVPIDSDHRRPFSQQRFRVAAQTQRAI